MITGKAEKKPVTIDYFAFGPNNLNVEGLIKWVESFGQIFEQVFELSNENTLKVKTLEGTSYEIVPERDVIIRGIAGEYYPCRMDIFTNSYNITTQKIY